MTLGKRTKWIVKVTIENFQSHERTVVRFTEGLNAITGPTDNGKSAVLRAIRWCLYNKPSGFEFLRHGTKVCRVIIEFSDGTVITRTRSASENSYDVTTPGRDPIHLEGFGVNAPAEVIEAHGMGLVMLNKESHSLNYAEQLDGPFFLKESESVRAEFIGSIAKASVIDAAIKSTNSDIRSSRADIARIGKNIGKLKGDIGGYDDLDALRILIGEINDIIAVIEARTLLYNQVKAVSVKLVNAYERQASAINDVDRYAVFDTLLKLTETLLERSRKHDEAMGLHNRITSEEKRGEVLRSNLDRYSACDEVLLILQDVKKKIESYNAISNKIDAIKNLESSQEKQRDVANKYSEMGTAGDVLTECQSKLFSYNKIAEVHAKLIKEAERKKLGTQVTANIKISVDQAAKKYQEAVTILGKCPICFNDVATDDTAERIHKHLL